MENLKKFDALVNPQNLAVYDIKVTNAKRADANCIDKPFRLAELAELGERLCIDFGIDLRTLGCVCMDYDGKKAEEFLARLEGLEYVLVRSARAGHYHLYFKRPEGLRLPLHGDGWTIHNYYNMMQFERSGQSEMLVVPFSPVLPSPWNPDNARGFEKIPSALSELPIFLYEKKITQ